MCGDESSLKVSLRVTANSVAKTAAAKFPGHFYRLSAPTPRPRTPPDQGYIADNLLGPLKQLVKIDVHNNLLTNTLPDSLWKLKRVNYIDFSQNDFSGRVPEELGYLTSLRVLKLNDNRLTGKVPDSFTLLDGLETLHCQFNNLKESAHWLIEYLPEIDDFEADEDGICSCSCKSCTLA